MNVEPDTFADGAVIGNAYLGVTLSVEGNPTAKVLARTAVANGGPVAGVNVASTGSLVFGYDIETGNFSPPEDSFLNWTTIAPAVVFRADFTVPTDWGAIDGISGDDNIAELSAFDVNGILLETFTTESYRNDVRTLSISRLTPDISYITAYGVAPEGSIVLDNLRFNNLVTASVSEPSSTLGLLGGIAFLIGFHRRRTF